MNSKRIFLALLCALVGFFFISVLFDGRTDDVVAVSLGTAAAFYLLAAWSGFAGGSGGAAWRMVPTVLGCLTVAVWIFCCVVGFPLLFGSVHGNTHIGAVLIGIAGLVLTIPSLFILIAFARRIRAGRDGD